MRSDSLKNSPQLLLGEMIAKLEAMPLKKESGEDKTVRFSFEYLFPTGLTSWRGSYDELSLEFTSSDFNDKEKPPTAEAFLKMLKEALGKTYTGYKGGDFVMGKSTPIWVANYGNSGNTGVVGLRDDGYEIIIETAEVEF